MKYPFAWLVAGLFAGVFTGVCLGQQAKLGLMPDGRVMLPTGWKIKPAGERVAVDTLPMSSAVSSDGKFVLVLNGGIHAPSISVIAAASKHELGRTPLPDAWLGLRMGLRMGLPMAPAGNLVYVGGGSSGKVYELALGPDGTLSRSREFTIADSNADSKKNGAPFIGDVALSPDGRVLYAADLYGDSIAQVNLQSGKMVDHWHTGRRPYRIAVSPDGAHLLISSWADGALYEHESGTGILVTKLRVGAHPTEVLWLNKPVSSGENGGSYTGRIFVAVENSNGVVELGVTQDGQTTSIETINVGLTPMNPLGMTPAALAVNAAGTRLYVACSGANAIAVADISQPPARLLGYVPSGWYPTSVGLLRDSQLVITNGNGSGEAAKQGENVATAPGTVQFVSAAEQADLHALSETVRDNSPYRDELIYGPISDPKEAFFLKLENHPSPLQHVIYLIKGNQSYDAVLGDLPKGNGDKTLARFGQVTPNLHELASQFVTYDNFYANGQATADGQNWSMGGIAPDYTVRLWPSAYAGRSHVFDFESADLSNTPPAGYLWNNAVAAGLTVRNYGEWVTNVSPAAADGSSQVKAVNDPSLAACTDQNFRGFDPAFKDSDRAREFIREWKAEDDKGALPQLSIVRLSNDWGNDGGDRTRIADAAHVADNDTAVGALVEAVSRSKAWSSTVIFVVESASGGADHVNGYRTPAWIVSPYTRQGSVDSALYNQMSVLTTLEIVLGLRPMTHFDAGARPMFGGFSQQANPAPFQAVPAAGSVRIVSRMARSRIGSRRRRQDRPRHRRVFAFLALVFLAMPASLGAQTNGQQNPAQTSNPGSVQGRIVDSTTGSGVAGASLHLFPRSSGSGVNNQAVSTTSLEDGSFRFEQVYAGSYVLFCTDADYVLAANQLQTVTVGAGQQVSDLALQLNPMGELHGKVMDETGKGVPGITVELFSTYNERGAMQLRRTRSTTSGPGGVYRLGKVRPGKYYLAAGGTDDSQRGRALAALNEQKKKLAAPPPTRTAEGVELNFVRTFYPKETSFEGASVLEIPPGGSVPDANVQLQRAETFHVSGKVESVGAASLRRGAMLSLAPRNTPALGGTGRTSTAQQNGTFFMDKVPSGSYTLWLLGSYLNGGEQGRRGARMRIIARQDIDVNASDVENIQLSFLPPVNLTGQVTLTNAPSTTATQMRVNLTPLQQTGLGGYVSIPVNADGTFALQDVDPGEYMIRLTNPPAGMYVKSLTWNQQDVTGSGIDLSQGGGGEIQISLKGGAAEVDGSVTAGGSSKSVSGMAVLVPETIPADGSGSFLSTIKADGTFAITSVPPGHYSAYAIEHWTNIWQNLDFLRMMQRNGTSVNVEENGHGQLQLSLITVDELQSDAGAVGLSLQ